MPNYYELWSRRVAGKKAEMDSVVAGIRKGVDAILRDSELERMLYSAEPREFSGSIAAVDGGEGLQELAGVAVYMVRASGLIKKAKAGKTSGKGAEGEFIRDLDLGVIPVNRQTKARVQFLRAAMEYETASTLIEKFRPDCLLIDGSLLVGVEIDPIKIDEYRAYIASVRGMLKLAREMGVQVVGVSEDSTSRGLIGYLSEKGLTKESSRAASSLTDASLIQLYAQRLEKFSPTATKPFIPVSNKGRDWVVKNTGIDCLFPTFYLQATQFGRAMRVDFPWYGKREETSLSTVLGHESSTILSPESAAEGKSIGETAKGIASMLTHLSQIPKRYGYPIPLYIAHSDAELPKKLMERTCLLIQKQIFKGFGDEYLSMYTRKRRDSRPFDYEG